MEEIEAITPTLRDGNIAVWFEDIGPERAEYLLSTYKTDYRRWRPTYSDGLARDMEPDPETGLSNWNFDGSPIRIDDQDNLFDGQHRLRAIKKSRTHHRFLMIAGLPMAAYNTTDTGLARNYGDLLRMRGFANVALRTAMLKLISRWEREVSLDDSKRLTHSELDRLNDRYVSEVNRALQQATGTRFKIPAPMSVVGFCWWLFREIDVEKATTFMAGVAEGERLEKGMPAYTLRERLRLDAEIKYSRTEYAHLFIASWNAFIRGDNNYYRIPIPSNINRQRMAVPLATTSSS